MATRLFLKLGNIEGSSMDDQKHKKWIEIESFGWGVSNSVNSTEKAKGNPGGEACSHTDVSINKIQDMSSTQLYAYCSAGKVFDKAIIEACEEEELLFKMTLTNAAISNVSLGCATSGVPNESFGLAFSGISWKYKDKQEDSWDLVTNKGSLKKK